MESPVTILLYQGDGRTLSEIASEEDVVMLTDRWIGGGQAFLFDDAVIGAHESAMPLWIYRKPGRFTEEPSQ